MQPSKLALESRPVAKLNESSAKLPNAASGTKVASPNILSPSSASELTSMSRTTMPKGLTLIQKGLLCYKSMQSYTRIA